MKHRGLTTLTLPIAGLSCPAISASGLGSASPCDAAGFCLVDAQSEFKAPGGPASSELTGWTSVPPPAVDVAPPPLPRQRARTGVR